MLSEITAQFMDLRLGSKVVSVDTEGTSAILESGEIIAGDLILGADGVNASGVQPENIDHKFTPGPRVQLAAAS